MKINRNLQATSARIVSIVLAIVFCMACHHQAPERMSKNDGSRKSRGVEQARALWTEQDGSQAEFEQLVAEYYCETDSARQVLFESLSRVLENMYQSADMLTVELLRPTQLTNASEPQTPDWIMSGYSPLAHFSDDMFANKLAFITIINFPHYTLEEKNTLCRHWTRQEWAYARMGDVFTTRVPASVNARIAAALADGENYIADYNIYMGNLRTEDGRQLWDEDKVLLSHWNLRDELKAQYKGQRDNVQCTKDNVQCTKDERQEMIYQVMQRIVDQSIPAEAVNNSTYVWKPYSNEHEGKAVSAHEPYTRYARILECARAFFEEDKYCPSAPSAIIRNFEEGVEIPAAELDSLFRALVGSAQVQAVASIIRERLGRELRPYDIWYDGFKARASLNEDELTAQTRRLYPDAGAFAADMPRLLRQMGFPQDEAQGIASHIVVEPARGSGHAWPCLGRKEEARLRTRIPASGMDYKGYNIAVHEFGHCVEQILDMYFIDHYMLSGVPNTAYTEASAFLWQQRDLQLLPGGEIRRQQSAMRQDEVLDQFWSMYEIMGVSLVDMRMWEWIYAHKDAGPQALCEATQAIAKDVWNRYYEPVLGEHDCILLGVYSHMVNSPMYLPNYPLGHIVQYQLEEYLSQCKTQSEFAREYARIYRLGRLTPKEWMIQAVGAPPSIEPILRAVDTICGGAQKQ
ncbi:MAG: hypothetical protein IJQ06_04870 [Paludibacteraceae bacterium]|nr:hypothetical protein [Paludibacteraceae bacterium]